MQRVGLSLLWKNECIVLPQRNMKCKIDQNATKHCQNTFVPSRQKRKLKNELDE